MAEYKMTYEELEEFVDSGISQTHGNRNALEEHKVEILVALTGVFSEEIVSNQKEVERLTDLWNNHQKEESQLLFV